MKRGVYLTIYGNNAVVSGPKARRGWDLDMGEWVPIDAITDEFIRKAEPEDFVHSDW